MQILIDAGHRETTPGKCSPDNKFREYKWTRACADELEQLLKAQGMKVWRVPQFEMEAPTPKKKEDKDLNARVRAANAFAKSCGEATMLVSIHCNGAGSEGKWLNARGWAIFVAPNASSTSKVLAESISSSARATGFRVLQQYANIGYWTKSLAICRDTTMPAVLVENFFMDNKEDCAYLLSERSVKECAKVIATGIKEMLR